jgi:phage shock protein E
MKTRKLLVRVLVCLATLGGFAALAAEPPVAAAVPAAAPAAAPEAATPISPSALLERLARPAENLVVLDVRTPAEFAAGHVPGARNLPHDQLAARVAELSAYKDRDVVLYCRSGRRSELARQTLRDAGFSRLLQLEGDWLAWEAQQRPVARPDDSAGKSRAD